MPRAMDWLHYHHPHSFRMVGREGSITEAGRRLGLVQTTVPGLAQTTVTGQAQPTVTGLA